MRKALPFAVLAGLLFLGGCFTYRFENCTLQTHASLFGTLFDVTRLTSTPTQTPQK